MKVTDLGRKKEEENMPEEARQQSDKHLKNQNVSNYAKTKRERMLRKYEEKGVEV